MRVDVRVRIDQDELFEFVKETLSEIAGHGSGSKEETETDAVSRALIDLASAAQSPIISRASWPAGLPTSAAAVSGASSAGSAAWRRAGGPSGGFEPWEIPS